MIRPGFLFDIARNIQRRQYLKALAGKTEEKMLVTRSNDDERSLGVQPMPCHNVQQFVIPCLFYKNPESLQAIQRTHERCEHNEQTGNGTQKLKRKIRRIDHDRAPISRRTAHPAEDQASCLTLSTWLMISVMRTPNFSLTTTGSPRASNLPFTRISRGSPASLLSSTTDP